jgi:1-acyl-sn-glycerol-3-phosphate acyltransferase
VPVSRRYTSHLAAAGRVLTQRVIMRSLVRSQLSITVKGRERLRDLSGAFVVVCNHTSHIDAPLILGSLPRRLGNRIATGAAADYFFDSKIRHGFITAFFNGFPIYRGSFRDRKSVAGELIEAGVPIMVFPEGTRSRTGAMGRFSVGTCALAISRGVPMLPVAIVGAYEAMPRGRNWPKPGRPPVHAVFGSPMLAAPGETPPVFAARVRAAVRDLFDEEAVTMGLPTQDQRDQRIATSSQRDPASTTTDDDITMDEQDAASTYHPNGANDPNDGSSDREESPIRGDTS